jgi:hypothetical protein
VVGFFEEGSEFLVSIKARNFLNIRETGSFQDGREFAVYVKCCPLGSTSLRLYCAYEAGSVSD